MVVAVRDQSCEARECYLKTVVKQQRLPIFTGNKNPLQALATSHSLGLLWDWFGVIFQPNSSWSLNYSTVVTILLEIIEMERWEPAYTLADILYDS